MKLTIHPSRTTPATISRTPDVIARGGGEHQRVLLAAELGDDRGRQGRHRRRGSDDQHRGPADDGVGDRRAQRGVETDLGGHAGHAGETHRLRDQQCGEGDPGGEVGRERAAPAVRREPPQHRQHRPQPLIVAHPVVLWSGLVAPVRDQS